MKFEEVVLVVDDDERVVRSLEVALSDIATVLGYTDPTVALDVIKARPVAVAIVDQRMPEMTGTELLAAVRQVAPSTVRFLLTGYSDVQAMSSAINDSQVHRYIEKPWDVEHLVRDVEAAIHAYQDAMRSADGLCHLEARSARLEAENAKLRRRMRELALDDEIITVNPGMEEALETVERAAVVTNAVLVYGESGTGKELVARRAHAIRHGPEAPFVALNCGAFSDGLVESELFGHEKGAFTGAVRSFPGAFERAHKGSLFLDEVGDLRLDLQGRLIRVLEDGLVRRLGGTRELSVDVTVLAATHRNLPAMVDQGLFRADVYYRLSAVEVSLPPLRERTEDIPLLLEHFMKTVRMASGRPQLHFTPAALEALIQHPFRGNVRELWNIVQRVAAVVRHDAVCQQDLTILLARPSVAAPSSAAIRPQARAIAENGDAGEPGGTGSAPEGLPRDLEELRNARTKARDQAGASVEFAFLSYWYGRCGGNLAEVSRATAMSRPYLYKIAKRSGFPLGGSSSNE